MGLFTTQVGLRSGWRSAGPVKKYTADMASSNKKTKRNVSESDSENEAADFPRFIVIESLEEVGLAKFSYFLIEKVLSTRASSKTVKKTRNGNLLVEVDSRRQAENSCEWGEIQCRSSAKNTRRIYHSNTNYS